MAERAEEVVDGDEIEAMRNNEEEDDAENNVTSSVAGDEAFLLELNLVLIIASLTLSNQDVSEIDKMDKHHAKEHDLKECLSNLRGGRKRDLDVLRLPHRPTTRVQTPRILDSRHGRKM